MLKRELTVHAEQAMERYREFSTNPRDYKRCSLAGRWKDYARKLLDQVGLVEREIGLLGEGLLEAHFKGRYPDADAQLAEQYKNHLAAQMPGLTQTQKNAMELSRNLSGQAAQLAEKALRQMEREVTSGYAAKERHFRQRIAFDW